MGTLARNSGSLDGRYEHGRRPTSRKPCYALMREQLTCSPAVHPTSCMLSSRYTSLHRSKLVLDFFENQSHVAVPKLWLHSAIPNTHHTNIVRYNTNSVLISIDMLSSYTCTNSMQDFLPGTYSPDQTKSITGLVSILPQYSGEDAGLSEPLKENCNCFCLQCNSHSWRVYSDREDKKRGSVYST
jgi:hypothetical protein